VTATQFVQAMTIYLAVGACIAAAFVTVGVRRVLKPAPRFSPMARVFLFPGAVALWPYVLVRWLRS
jgi:hypothetical protein